MKKFLKKMIQRKLKTVHKETNLWKMYRRYRTSKMKRNIMRRTIMKRPGYFPILLSRSNPKEHWVESSFNFNVASVLHQQYLISVSLRERLIRNQI